MRVKRRRTQGRLRRGLTDKDYRVCLRRVNAHQVTWEQLEAAGIAKPPRNRSGLSARILEAVNGRKKRGSKS